MNSISIAIVGGDLRFVRLCKILCDKGFDTWVYGITHPDIPKEAKVCHSLDDLRQCPYIIAPIPFSNDGKSVFTPLSNLYISIELFIESITNSFLIAGAIRKDVKALLDKHQIKYQDLMQMDEVAILNAIPTAEGAIQYAMQNSEITLHDSKCLVLGFGRCGKILANKLKGIGADVYVEARSTTDLAFISTYDYKPIALHDLKQHLGEFDFIFNTIPVLILDKDAIDLMSPGVIYIELASAPYGIDINYCAEKGINHIPAPSLPGKVAPTTAASIIYQGLLLILRNQEAIL